MLLSSTNFSTYTSHFCARTSGVTDSLTESWGYRIILCNTCVEIIL
jgi:hypothetical protein